MAAVSQRLHRAGVNMAEYPQSSPNLTASSQNLYELIKGRNIVAYPDPQLRLALSRTVALESARGWRIAKDKQTHKVDVVVALAMAALAAIQKQSRYRYASDLNWVRGDADAEADEFLQRRLTQHILAHGGFYRQQWR
jgi:phage terminase large subunit-like protein